MPTLAALHIGLHLGLWLLEAAFRSLLMGIAVWTGIRLLRVHAVLAQKVAWVLVLTAAVAMPLVMHTPWLALNRAFQIPLRSRLAPEAAATVPPKSPAASPAAIASVPITPAQTHPSSRLPKPPAAHRVLQSTAASLVNRQPEIKTAITRPQLADFANRSTPPATPTARPSLWNRNRIAALLEFTYLAVLSLLLLRTLYGLATAYRIWRQSSPVELQEELQATLPSPASATQTLRIRSSTSLSTPVTIGSTVILPADFRAWDHAKLRIVLAHEQSHVRQRDFYLQLFAAIHAAIFWFSPLGWWLQRKLSELGEALSDRAGLEQSPDAASYAQILLEFAALSRPHSTRNPLAGVAMARTSNLSSRIERILNDRRFRLAFLGERRHAAVAAILAPAALVAAVALIRIVPSVPAVQAAQVTARSPLSNSASQQLSTGTAPGIPAIGLSGTASLVTPTPQPELPVEIGQAAAPSSTSSSPETTHSSPTASNPDAAPEASEDTEPAEAQFPVPPPPPGSADVLIFRKAGAVPDFDPLVIVHGKDRTTLDMSDDSDTDLEKARMKFHDNFLWFKHNGKSWVITDPAIVARSKALFADSHTFDLAQGPLQQQQMILDMKMRDMQLIPDKFEIKLDSPEFKLQMARVQVELDQIQKLKIDVLPGKLTEGKLAELQQKMAAIQGQLGEIQGRLDLQNGLQNQIQNSILLERRGPSGDPMGKIVDDKSPFGDQQGEAAEGASRRMKAILDQAIKDGKAKPVN